MVAKRLLVSLEEDTFNEITYLAKINRESLSKIGRDLIINSLKIQEDKMFARLADERLSNAKEWISHEEAWK